MNHASRTIVYVDGFNFYYGAVKNTPHKWLDLERFFSLLRPHDDIQIIKYFTAHVSAGPHLTRQRAFLNALATRPRIKIILGQFKKKSVKCTYRGCTGTTGNRIFKVPEEKRTDVNIAIHMLDDAYQGLCDRQVLVSGDSDLIPALHAVRKRFPTVKTTVYVPAQAQSKRSYAVELRSAADRHRLLPLNLLPKAQFPARIPDGSGGFIEKPGDW